MAGFGKVVVNDIYLTVATTRTQNAMLNPGAVSTEVQVSAASSEVTLNTTDATIGNNFDVKLLDELPVQVRDTPASLFTLQPGISASRLPGGPDQSYVSVDGLDVNDISTGQTFMMVANAPVDSVEEFKGTVAGDTADSGPASGGEFELVTKSGSNRWHGNVNGSRIATRRRSPMTGSATMLDCRLRTTCAIEFGGNIGGPIKKDKAFFFFNFYDLRRATSSPW